MTMNDRELNEQLLTGFAAIKASLLGDLEGTVALMKGDNGIAVITGLFTVAIMALAQAYDLDAVTPEVIDQLAEQISNSYLESFENPTED